MRNKKKKKDCGQAPPDLLQSDEVDKQEAGQTNTQTSRRSADGELFLRPDKVQVASQKHTEWP